MAGADDVDQQKIEAARRKRDLDAKFRGMIREIAWQIIMLVLFTWVIVGSLDANVYYQNQDIRSAFIDVAEVILSHAAGQPPHCLFALSTIHAHELESLCTCSH